jgi:hypothetical protein
LPVAYFHLVFTVQHNLNGLVGSARHARAALLAAPDPVVAESVAAFLRRIYRVEWARCPHCRTGQYLPTAAIAPTGRGLPLLQGPP